MKKITRLKKIFLGISLAGILQLGSALGNSITMTPDYDLDKKANIDVFYLWSMETWDRNKTRRGTLDPKSNKIIVEVPSFLKYARNPPLDEAFLFVSLSDGDGIEDVNVYEIKPDSKQKIREVKVAGWGEGYDYIKKRKFRELIFEYDNKKGITHGTRMLKVELTDKLGNNYHRFLEIKR